MHHAIVEVNIVIGVVLGELHVARVVPLVVDAVIGLTLGLIAHVVVVVFIVAILHRIFLYETSRHCCMPAVNTSSVSTSVAVVLLCVRWFVTDQARCAFVGARQYNVCSIGSRRVWHHQSPGYRNAKATILTLICYTARLHEVRTSV